jgi:ribosomal protein L11 methyltransferase (prmA)
MNNYIEARIELGYVDANACCEPDLTTASDMLSAFLGEIGFESFVFENNVLTAYVRSEAFSSEAFAEVLDQLPLPQITLSAETEEIEGRDWNHEWEKNYFQPIVVADRCVIHSTFHTDYPKCEYDIVIDPKMAFGTGHHATTSQIIAQLLEMDLTGKAVVDMGTGTGILAILAAMRGAAPVVAIEIDPAAEVNARENMALNHQAQIDLRLGDATMLEGCRADVFIANINRNIILNDLEAYAATLNRDAIMILSGFYESDIPMLQARAAAFGLEYVRHTTQGDNWACLVLRKMD